VLTTFAQQTLLENRASIGVSRTFTAQTTTGATVAYNTGVAQNHSSQLIVTGGPATCSYTLQGSNDGTNWFAVSGAITCTSTTSDFQANKPVKLIRGNLGTLTGGTAPTVTLAYAGK
jgi:hypothetical protein